MNQHIQLPPQKQRRGMLRSFGLGVLVVVIIGAVYIAGIKVGSGEWSVSFANRSVSSNGGLPSDLNYASVEQVYDELRQKYDGKLDEKELMAGLKKGLVDAAGDPYTSYLDNEAAQEFNEQLSGTFSGIGAELGKEEGGIVVISPIAGFPAEKAGLKSKDVILAIDDQDATNLNVDEAVKRIRGPEGTDVKLTVLRGGEDRLDFKITRAVIDVPSVETKVLDGQIGYMRVTRFSSDTVELAEKAAREFRSQNINKVILDVRGNPGGYLNAAVDLSDIWLGDPKNVIVQEKRDGRVVESFNAKLGGTLNGVKTVVLIDGGSASASEITAGALHDNKAATIIGTKSYGKGSVQEFSNLRDGDVLKVTIARWFTPAGKNIDKEGIVPDIAIEVTDADNAAGKDPQLERAQAFLLGR